MRRAVGGIISRHSVLALVIGKNQPYNKGHHARAGSLKIDRDIHAALEPNDEVSLRHDGNDLSREDETGAIAADDAKDLPFFDF